MTSSKFNRPSARAASDSESDLHPLSKNSKKGNTTGKDGGVEDQEGNGGSSSSGSKKKWWWVCGLGAMLVVVLIFGGFYLVSLLGRDMAVVILK